MAYIEHSIRKAKSVDEPYILSTWRAGAKDTPHYKVFAPDEYNRAMRALVNRVYKQSSCMVLSLSSSSTFVTGYIVYRKDVLHYCYVGKDFRRLGLAKMLLRAAGIPHDKPTPCTFWTKTSDLVADSLDWIYRPTLLNSKPAEDKNETTRS